MRNSGFLGPLVVALIASLAVSGCSTLGFSLYPTGERLTTEAKQVLDNSRIPRGIPRENAKSVLPAHALQPGDVVLIEPVNLERDLRLPGDQSVLADGTLDLGAYGRVVVAGRDLEQAEALIEQQIAYYLREQSRACKSLPDGSTDLSADCDGIAVNVRLVEPVHRFYVLGEVNAPGAYPLTGSETVLDAIVEAGGLSDRANPCEVLLARPTGPCECRVTLPVCYREIVQLGSTTTNYQLQPGDRIFVSARSCLDEIMFWRASWPCSRCAGCNQACRNPPISTAKPMPLIEAAMIPPGSRGRTDLADELLSDTTIARSRLQAPDNRPADAAYEVVPSQSQDRANSGSDIDGELEF